MVQHGDSAIVVSFPASAEKRISCRTGFKTEEYLPFLLSSSRILSPPSASSEPRTLLAHEPTRERVYGLWDVGSETPTGMRNTQISRLRMP